LLECIGTDKHSAPAILTPKSGSGVKNADARIIQTCRAANSAWPEGAAGETAFSKLSIRVRKHETDEDNGEQRCT
jgi:hypothetical protein